jgi:hypothetical protein
MNHEDSEDIAFRNVRKQSDDLDAVIDAWNKLCCRLRAWHDRPLNLGASFAFDSGQSTSVRVFDIDASVVEDAIFSVSRAVRHDLPSSQFLFLNNFDGSMYCDQVLALNCISNLTVTTDPNKRQGQHIYWQLQGLRTKLFQALEGSDFSIEIASQIYRELNERAVELKTMSDKRRSSTRRISTSRKKRTTHSGAGIKDSPDADASSWTRFPSFSSQSLISRVRSSLIKHGLFRTLRCDENCIEVVWNAYHPNNGELRSMQFCTTTVEFVPEYEPRYVCEGCASFQHSTQLDVDSDDDGVVPGFCAHTYLLALLLPHLKEPHSTPHSGNDRFINWVNKCNVEGDDIVKLFDDGALGKFFVKVSDGVARAERTSEVAIVCVWLACGGTNRLSCSALQCVDVTMKKVKKVKNVEKLCCHLRSLFEQESCQRLWTMGTRDCGFDVNGVSELEAAVHDVEGLFSCRWHFFFDFLCVMVIIADVFAYMWQQIFPS